MEEKKKEMPLSVMMEEVKKGYVNAIQEVNKKFNVPAFIADPILTIILNDIRNQKNMELAYDYKSMEENKEKEGD